MRETLYLHGSRLVVIRVGADASLRFVLPNEKGSAGDLTDQLPRLLELGWTAKPLREPTFAELDADKVAAVLVELSLGADGFVTVFNAPSGQAITDPVLGERLMPEEVVDVATRGLCEVLDAVAAAVSSESEQPAAADDGGGPGVEGPGQEADE
jgi:hypothetical protein